MKLGSGIVLACALAVMTGIGCGPKLKNVSSTLGACSFPADFRNQAYCVDYNLSGSFKEDPTSKVISGMRSNCPGSFSASTPCSKTNVTGACKIAVSRSVDGQSFTVNALAVYPSRWLRADAESHCSTQSGTFSTSVQ